MKNVGVFGRGVRSGARVVGGAWAWDENSMVGLGRRLIMLRRCRCVGRVESV